MQISTSLRWKVNGQYDKLAFYTRNNSIKQAIKLILQFQNSIKKKKKEEIKRN